MISGKLRSRLYILIGFVASSMVAATSSAAQPNILFILTDDQSRQTLGCYGGNKVATPHLDGLAHDGIRFTDAYVTPQCTPTRASLFTGQHTARNGMWHVIGWYGYPWARVAEPAFVEQLPRDAFTLPKGLRAAGYTTGMAGKWHLTNNADGKYSGLNPEAADAYGFDYVAPAGPGTSNQGDKWVDYLTDQTIGFIERNRERPWFFYLAHHTVHSVVTAPPELVAEYRAGGAPDEGLHNAVILAAIKHLDDSIGRLLAKIDDLGLREQTLVVFLSDNGGIQSVYDATDFTNGAGGGLRQLRVQREEYSNAPFRAGKGSPYEGGLRVPCLVRWPGVVEAGKSIATPIHVVDWLPTLFEIAGSESPKGRIVDGVSLAPLLRGGNLESRPLFWYMPLYDLRWAATPCAVIRDGDWKLVDYFGDSFDANGNYREGARSELFNLAADPGEKNDLVLQEADRAAALRSRLSAWMRGIPVAVPTANPHYDPQRSFCETKQKQPWNQTTEQDQP
jgi:arylsulfatase A